MQVCRRVECPAPVDIARLHMGTLLAQCVPGTASQVVGRLVGARAADAVCGAAEGAAAGRGSRRREGAPAREAQGSGQGARPPQRSGDPVCRGARAADLLYEELTTQFILS